MSLSGAIVGVIILIWLLSVLRNRLIFETSSLSLLLLGKTIYGEWLYSIIFLPGTILHEISHFLMAELLGVRTGTIEILPNFSEKTPDHRARLGSVETVQTDPIRSFLIGIAPFITGIATLWILATLLSKSTLSSWYLAAVVYAIAVVGSSMLLSREDRRNWPFILVLLIILLTLYFIQPYRLSTTALDKLLPLFTTLLSVLSTTIGVILGLNGIMYSLRRIIEKILGKKVIRR